MHECAKNDMTGLASSTKELTKFDAKEARWMKKSVSRNVVAPSSQDHDQSPSRANTHTDKVGSSKVANDLAARALGSKMHKGGNGGGHDLSVYMLPAPSIGGGPVPRHKYEGRRPQKQIQVQERAQPQRSTPFSGSHTSDISIRIRNSLLKLQRVMNAGPNFVDDFFGSRVKDSELTSKVEQLPSSARTTAMNEIVGLCRFMLGVHTSKTDQAFPDRRDYDARSLGGLPTPSPIPDIQNSFSESPFPPPSKNPQVLPPLARNSQQSHPPSLDSTSKSTDEPNNAKHSQKKSSSVDMISSSKTKTPTPPENADSFESQNVNIPKIQTIGSGNITIAKEQNGVPSRETGGANGAKNQSTANLPTSSPYDSDSDRPESAMNTETVAEKRMGQRKGSNPKLNRAWAKLKAIRAVFSSHTNYYTNPHIAKKVFSLLSNRRNASRQKFINEWAELDHESQNEWMQELANQFSRIGTALTVLSDATSTASFTESLNNMCHAITDVVVVKSVHIFRLDDYLEEFRIVASSGSFDPEAVYSAGDGIPGRVMKTSESFIAENFTPEQSDHFDLNPSFMNLAVYCHPLFDQSEKVLGAILVTASSLTVEDIRLLDTLSAHAGLLMANLILSNRESRVRLRFSALVDISNIVSSELRLQPLIDVLRTKSRELLQADKCTMYLVDREKQELWTTLQEGQEIHFPLNQGIAGHVATTGDIVNIVDAYNDERFNPQVDHQTGYRTKSILCMPVKRLGGEIVGVIQMINKAHGPFTSEDESLMEAFCSQAAIAITNSQIYHQEIQEKLRFQALVDISKVISSELQLGHLIDVLRAKSRELVHADRCTLFLVDEKSQKLWTKLVEGKEVQIPIGSGIVGHVAKTGMTLNIRDAYSEPRFNPDVDRKTGYVTKSILCMPVKTHQGKIVGAIQMVNKLSGAEFNSDDENLLSAFCSHAAVAIVNSQLYEETVELYNYLRSILKSIKNYVLHIDQEGRLLTVNHPLSALFGSEDDYFRMTPYQMWFGRKNVKLVSDIKRVLDNPNEPVYNPGYSLAPRATNGLVNLTEINILGKDVPNPSLVSIPVNYMIVSLTDAKGRQNGILLMIEDISEMESIRQAMGSLQNRLGDVTNQATQVIEAPIQMVIRTIQHLAKGRFDPDEAQQQLLECLSVISKVDLFKPKIEEILDQSLDTNTKLWLMSEVALPEDIHLNVATSWPDLAIFLNSSLSKNEAPSELFDWHLDASKLGDSELITLIVHMFKHLGVLGLFNIKVETLQAFLEAIRKNYNPNPFHNFQHSFTVTHVVFLMITQTSLTDFLSNQDILSLMLAALCHDLDHPGLTNGFEISSESPLATLYNDVSVLENHHSFMAFRLLRGDNGILTRFSPPEKKEMRKLIVNSILSTDMGRHFEDLAKLNQRIETKPISRDSLDDRVLVASVMLHCADLSNPTRQFPQSRMWAERLIKEFSLQVEKEKENGMPVSTFMIIPNMLVQSKNEMNFIDYVVEPLWKAAKRIIPELEPLHAQLLKNRGEWASLLAEAQASASPSKQL